MSAFPPDVEARRPKVTLMDDMPERWRVLFRGAEAVVYEGEFAGRACVLKQRIPKRYRHPDLDARLLRQRTSQEARCLARLAAVDGLRVPAIYLVRPDNFSLYLQRIDGSSLKAVLDDLTANVLAGMDVRSQVDTCACKIAIAVAKMHSANVVHGDLTTSNMLLDSVVNDVVLIDFGLGQASKSVEDKAVDLYVLERSFSSVHAALSPQIFHSFLHVYRDTVADSSAIMSKLAEVQLRGRKRSMVG